MGNEVDAKLEDLLKYIPIIDFMISVDREKYKKFIDMRSWILNKTRFPLIDLAKIEQSIIVQYRSMQLPKDTKVPKSLPHIISTATPPTYTVDLCSDDEDQAMEISQRGCNDNGDVEKVDFASLSVMPPAEKYSGASDKQHDTNDDEHTTKIFNGIEEIVCDLENGQDSMEEKLFTRRSNYPTKPRKRDISPKHKVGDMINLEPIVLSSSEDEENIGDKSNILFDKATPKTSIIPNININNSSSTETSGPVQGTVPTSSAYDSDLSKLNVEELYNKLLGELGKQLGINNHEYLKHFMNNLLTKDNNEDSEQKPATSSSQNSHNIPNKDYSKITSNSTTNNTTTNNATTITTTTVTIPPHITHHQQLSNNHLFSKAMPPMVAFPPQSPYVPFIQPSLTSPALAAPNRYLVQRTINLKDPRIIKKLHEIQDSPNYFANMQENAAHNCNVPHTQVNIQPQFVVQGPNVVHNPSTTNANQVGDHVNSPSLDHLPTLGSRLMLKGHNSKISYSEYKRRKAEEKMQIEDCTNNSENRASKVDQQTKLSEVMEREKATNEIRSILCTTLLGKEKEIETAWNQLNQRTVSVSPNKTIVDKNEKTPNKKQVPTRRKSEQPKPKSKIERVFKELHCSMEGYNTMQDLISIGGKRRSSLHAREMIAEQLNNKSEASSSSSNDEIVEKIKIRRTSNGVYKIRNCNAVHESDSDFENELNNIIPKEKILSNEIILKNAQSKQLYVKVKRLTNREICGKQSQLTTEVSNVEKIAPSSKKALSADEINNKSQINESLKRTVKQLPPLSKQINKILNNDCRMTELNTRFCRLCTSRPSDLTNHYIRKHKTESYVSRLTSAQLDDLRDNINFATPQYRSSVRNFAKPCNIRYKVICPFCEDDLIQPFLSLYDHYSKHTGEYPYECSFCALSKPFRVDIQSHQQHSKNCHKATINIMYRYRPNTTVIYVYYCRICNFTQLNEANVLKHLREHHNVEQASEQNVEKCVLAAIQDACDMNEDANLMNISKNVENLDKETNESNGQIDEDILVCNEAIDDDVEMTSTTNLTLSTPFDNVNTTVSNKVVTSKDNLSHNEVKEDHNICINGALFPTSTSVLLEHHGSDKENEAPLTYRLIPPNVSYLGLYKCMADDCYYSTESGTDMLGHLTDHENSECPPAAYLQCAYCVLHLNECNTSMELVQHIRLKHEHNVYQCSICCYRSCDASNVFIHQQLKHSFTEAERLIFKCTGPEITYEEKKPLLNELKIKSVQKLKCPICESKFYATIHLQQHLNTSHDLDARTFKLDCLKTLSCIYCETTDRDKKNMHIHLATNHPNELPYICDHNVTENNEDSVDSLQLFDLSQMVAVTVKNICRQDNDGGTPPEEMDVKPDINKLLSANEEIVKVRLRKLTETTGIDLDHLYRCPQEDCGGYFSSYELWLRHMKRRHCCFECICPHCSQSYTNNDDTSTKYMLKDFQQHFEQHRRHTYTCFHCPETFKYENELRHHGENTHRFKEIRFEKITFSFHCSYNVLIEKDLHKDRSHFVRYYMENLEIRLKKFEEHQLENLQRQWLVTSNSWFDEFFVNLMRSRRFIKCIKENECNYLGTNEEDVYEHIRTQHKITDSTFRCTQCYYVLSQMNDWDEALKHVKGHFNSLYICCICSEHRFCRLKMTEHIKANHNARDVPIIHLLEKSTNLYMELSVVFASGLRSFSSTRDCFCCNERNMTADTFLLHLKHYHKFTLTYFCEFCKIYLPSPKLSGQHFFENHPNEKIKLHCKFASNDSLNVESIQPLRLNISKSCEAMKSITIKKEYNEINDGNAVFILEDDDISVNEDIRLQASTSNTVPTPKLQCVPMNKLLHSTDEVVTPPRSIPVRISSTNGTTIPLTSHYPKNYVICTQPNQPANKF